MVAFSDLLSIARNVGFFEFYLPFVLSFALFYGILQKVDIFKSRNINLVISLVLALYVIGFTPVGTTFAQFLTNFFGDVALILVSTLGLLMIFFVLVPLSGKEFKDLFKPVYLLPIAVLLALGAFMASGGLSIFPGIQLPGGGLGLGLSDQDLVIIGVLLLTVLVIYWLTKESKEEKQFKVAKMQKELQG